jgi:hypothetical protein
MKPRATETWNQVSFPCGRRSIGPRLHTGSGAYETYPMASGRFVYEHSTASSANTSSQSRASLEKSLLLSLGDGSRATAGSLCGYFCATLSLKR